MLIEDAFHLLIEAFAWSGWAAHDHAIPRDAADFLNRLPRFLLRIAGLYIGAVLESA